MFRAINKAGRVWEDGMSPKVLWDVVRRSAPLRVAPSPWEDGCVSRIALVAAQRRNRRHLPRAASREAARNEHESLTEHESEHVQRLRTERPYARRSRSRLADRLCHDAEDADHLKRDGNRAEHSQHGSGGYDAALFTARPSG